MKLTAKICAEILQTFILLEYKLRITYDPDFKVLCVQEIVLKMKYSRYGHQILNLISLTCVNKTVTLDCTLNLSHTGQITVADFIQYRTLFCILRNFR